MTLQHARNEVAKAEKAYAAARDAHRASRTPQTREALADAGHAFVVASRMLFLIGSTSQRPVAPCPVSPFCYRNEPSGSAN